MCIYISGLQTHVHCLTLIIIFWNIARGIIQNLSQLNCFRWGWNFLTTQTDPSSAMSKDQSEKETSSLYLNLNVKLGGWDRSQVKEWNYIIGFVCHRGRNVMIWIVIKTSFCVKFLFYFLFLFVWMPLWVCCFGAGNYIFRVLAIWASDIQILLAWIRLHSSNTTPPPSCKMCQIFKAFRMWKSTDMFVEYILSKTISCTFILLKMTIIILLVILANNFQFHNGKCWFKPCVSPSFFGPSVSCGVFNLPCLTETRKENPLLFFQLPQNSLQINICFKI